MKVLLWPVQTISRIGIGIDECDISAISSCCLEIVLIENELDQVLCSACGKRVYSMSLLGPARSATSICMDVDDLVELKRLLNNWVAGWTSLDEDEFEINIERG